jgi:hypothetical protein
MGEKEVHAEFAERQRAQSPSAVILFDCIIIKIL